MKRFKYGDKVKHVTDATQTMFVLRAVTQNSPEQHVAKVQNVANVATGRPLIPVQDEGEILVGYVCRWMSGGQVHDQQFTPEELVSVD
jgi:uncharacterized protein YodC (DUF2158 family)